MREGWGCEMLGSVSAISYGFTEKASSDPIGPRFLRITDIQDNRVDWDAVPFCKIASRDFPKYCLASGDIVFARTGATTGKSFLVQGPPEAVFASYLIRLRLLDKRLLPEFVSLFFQTDRYWRAIREGVAGSAQGGFNASKLAALSIPVPPLSEQQRIVGIIGEAFEAIGTATANAEKNLQNARAVFDSYLHAAFSGCGEERVERPLGDVCQTASGGTPLKERKEYYDNGNIPWLLSGEVGQGEVWSANNFITEKGLQNSSAKVFPENTVLVAMYGATAGQVGILRFSAATNQAVCGILPGERFVPEFLFYCLLSKRDTLVSQAAGNAQPNISQAKIRNVAVPIIAIARQRQIVMRLDTLHAEAKHLEAIYQRKLAALDELKKSLLHRAFSGEL